MSEKRKSAEHAKTRPAPREKRGAPRPKRKRIVPAPPNPLGVDLPPRLEGETLKAYDAFSRYALMEPAERAQRIVAADLGHAGPTTVERWAMRYAWTQRTKTFDDRRLAERRRRWHELRDQDDIKLLERERNAERKARVALEEKAVSALEQIIEGSESDVARVSAVRELRVIAAHAPARPIEPPREGAASSGISAADVVRWLLDNGLPRAEVVKLADQLRDRLDDDADD